MNMIKANTIMNFKVRTARKGEGFSLQWEGQLTTLEDSTKKALSANLIDQFLQDINGKLSTQNYRPEEIRISLAVA